LRLRLHADQGLGWRGLRGGIDGEAEGHDWDQDGDLPLACSGDSAAAPCDSEADAMVLENDVVRRAAPRIARIYYLRQRIAACRKVCWACARERGE